MVPIGRCEGEEDGEMRRSGDGDGGLAVCYELVEMCRLELSRQTMSSENQDQLN